MACNAARDNRRGARQYRAVNTLAILRGCSVMDVDSRLIDTGFFPIL
jgi:hypothetical protein